MCCLLYEKKNGTPKEMRRGVLCLLDRNLIAMFMAVVLLFLPTQVLALDYEIEDMQIEVQLQEDGHASVIETQRYHFSDAFNGVTRTLIPKEDASIADFEATENDKRLQVEQDGNVYKIYRSGENETVTIITTYKIENGIEKYEDAAQFYWPFFDDRNESDYLNIEIIVHPPEKTKDALAIGYDAAEGSERVLDDGTVHFSLGHVSSGENGDIRVTYDSSLFPGVSLIKEGKIRDEIVAEQEEKKERKVAYENREKSLKRSAPYVIGVSAVLLFGLLLYARQKRQLTKAEVDRQYPLPYFIPEETMSLPATIAYMKGSSFIDADVLTVAMLDLVRQGLVKGIDDKTFQVVHTHATYDHERHIIDWLFYKVGEDGTFHVNDLKEYTNDSSHASTFREDYYTWRKLIREEVKQHKLYENYTLLRVGVASISLALIPFIIFYIIHHLILYFVVTSGILITLSCFALFFRPKTLKGMKLKRDWNAFLQKYVDFEEKDWQELKNDEQKRAYLYSFAIKDKQVKRKNGSLLRQKRELLYADPHPIYFLLTASAANHYFQDAHKSAEATTNAPSAGISGGGGVGGGGGGSGAF